jgi:hypothetical protein
VTIDPSLKRMILERLVGRPAAVLAVELAPPSFVLIFVPST